MNPLWSVGSFSFDEDVAAAAVDHLFDCLGNGHKPLLTSTSSSPGSQNDPFGLLFIFIESLSALVVTPDSLSRSGAAEGGAGQGDTARTIGSQQLFDDRLVRCFKEMNREIFLNSLP